MYGVKVLSKDFSTELHTIACERQTFSSLIAAEGRFARRNSTRKTSLNGDERGGDERGGTQLAKRPSMAMREEKRQSFAGYNTLVT